MHFLEFSQSRCLSNKEKKRGTKKTFWGNVRVFHKKYVSLQTFKPQY